MSGSKSFIAVRIASASLTSKQRDWVTLNCVNIASFMSTASTSEPKWKNFSAIALPIP